LNNYKLIIQYDGTDYAGWQIQENAKTIQGVLADSVKTFLREEINLIGSGRTDSGVHAIGQVANFRCENKIDICRFNHSLNSILPVDISVLKIDEVGESFHSRFDAKLRTYLYVISKIKSPFYFKYSINKRNLDVKSLNQLSKNFLGKKDFSSFCKKKSDVENRFCEIKQVIWRETKNFYLFFISADRFLHGMVRTLIGTLFNAVDKKNGDNYIKEVVQDKSIKSAGESVPPKGLFLYRVDY
jgi:tRNA pseudouridine38-40 synthase